RIVGPNPGPGCRHPTNMSEKRGLDWRGGSAVEVNGMDTKPVNLVDVELVNPNDDAFPFRTELSFCQLIGFWAQEEATDNPVRAAMARGVRERLRGAPDLSAP